MSQPTLNGQALLQLSWSGFNYPGNAQMVPLLGDGTTPGGNAVLQQSALGFRQASITGHALTPSDKDAIRALSESHAPVAYVDHDGNSTTVRVLTFDATLLVGDHWEWSATLVEMS